LNALTLSKRRHLYVATPPGVYMLAIGVLSRGTIFGVERGVGFP